MAEIQTLHPETGTRDPESAPDRGEGRRGASRFRGSGVGQAQQLGLHCRSQELRRSVQASSHFESPGAQAATQASYRGSHELQQGVAEACRGWEAARAPSVRARNPSLASLILSMEAPSFLRRSQSTYQGAPPGPDGPLWTASRIDGRLGREPRKETLGRRPPQEADPHP